MEITRITNENASYFLPREALSVVNDEGVLVLGSLSDDKKPLGYLIANADAGGLFIERIFTSEPERRKGYASALLDRAESICTKSGIPHIYTILFLEGSETETDPAYRLFKKAGFADEDSPSCRKNYRLSAIIEADPFKDATLPKGASYRQGDPITNKYGGSIIIDGSEVASLDCEEFYGDARITRITSDGSSLPLLSFLLKEAAMRMNSDGVESVLADITGERLVRFEELYTKKYKIESITTAKTHILIKEATHE